MFNKFKPSYPLIIIYFLPLLTVIIITLCLYLNYDETWILVGILGTLFSLRYADIAVVMLKNLLYLDKKGFLNEIKKVKFQKIYKHFGISDKFIISYQHHIILPIEYIESVNIKRKIYVNSLKGYHALHITMCDKKTFVFLYYRQGTRKHIINTLEPISHCIQDKIYENNQSTIQKIKNY